jgi:hypothetical protein
MKRERKKRWPMFALLTDLLHARKRSEISTIVHIFLAYKDSMSRIGTNGYWKKTTEG